MMKKPFRVLLVDDHYVVRVGLMAILSHEEGVEVVGEADDGPSAVNQYRAKRPDIVLMDLRMPGMSGVDATLTIRNEFPDARIVILTTFDGDEDIHRALQAGARGYLLKTTMEEELMEAMLCVLSGELYLPPSVKRRLSERNPESDLTHREIEVLNLMVKGLSNPEIGAVLGCSRSTAKFHVKNILRKLDVTGRAEAISTAISRGILYLG